MKSIEENRSKFILREDRSFKRSKFQSRSCGREDLLGDEDEVEHEIVQRRRGVQVRKGGQSPDEVSQTLLSWEGDY